MAVVMMGLFLCPYLMGGDHVVDISLLESAKITDFGLKFDNYQFSPKISPHGDCIDVVNGYIFVTWYRGGMDDRHLMLSRKQIGSGVWKTIEFPHQHVGYRGDPTIGDSHNTAAVAVCTIDNTVHMLYDMHSYNKTQLPDDYFNYSVSVAQAAFVPDEQWTLDLFYPKRNYLKAGVNYEDVTYPGFVRCDDGSLIADWRYRGSGNGDDYYAIYDGSSWSNSIKFNNGNLGVDRYNNYGGARYLNGKYMSGFSIRYGDSSRDDIPLNSGLYYAEATSPFGAGDWQDVDGNPITLPVQNPDVIKIGEPTELGLGNYMNSGPNWIVSENGSVHFMTKVSGTNVHYYRAAGDADFTVAFNSLNGKMYSVGNYILMADKENNRPCIRIAPEGTNNWQTIYQETSGPTIQYFRTDMEGDKMVYYLMGNGSGTAQPLHVMTYLVDFTDITEMDFQMESVDDFESYAVDTFMNNQTSPGPLGGLWDSDDESDYHAQRAGKITLDGANQVVHQQYRHNGRRTLCVNGLADSIDEGQTGVLFFRFKALSTTNPISWYAGVHDLTGSDPLTVSSANETGKLIAGFHAVGDGGSTFDIKTLDDSVTLLTALSQNQWYSVWMVVDNDSDTFDVYMMPASDGAGDPGMLRAYVIGSDLAFAISTTQSLTGGLWHQAGGNSSDMMFDEVAWLGNIPPDVPDGLTATAGFGSISLDWADNAEPDLAGYNVYRSTASGGPYTLVAMGVTTSDYVDNGLTNGTQYYYVVTAFDNESKESGYSNEAADTPFESRIHSYSSTQDGNEPKNILDGDVSDDSRWSAQTFPQWVIVDYGRTIWIKGIRIWTYQDRAYQFTIEASLVPTSDYIPIVDRSANTDGTQPISDDFSSVSARYLRLTITGASGYTGDWCSITEFQIVEGEPNPDFLEPVGVGLEDFAYLAGYWQRSNCSSVNNGYCFGADLNHSGQVDIMDLGLFVEWWLQDPMTVGQ